MKTFQEFISLAERYYGPDEKLPSGRTPYENANRSRVRQTEKYYSKPENERSLKDINRLAKHSERINQKVRHGSDNPNFNLHRDLSGEVHVSGHDDSYMKVKHPKSGVTFSVSNTGKKTKDGKPVHDIEWYHNKGNTLELDDDERKDIIRSARDVWTNHISHRLPHGSVIRSFPISNYGSNNGKPRYTRAKLYSRVAGFGKRNDRTGYQFAGVGREPSPKQKEKGRKRTYPMNSNTETSSVFEEFIELAERYYEPDEKLPSGDTPLGRALKKLEKDRSEIGPNSNIVRMRRHSRKIETKVKHGADNPKYNSRVDSRDDDEIRVDSDGDNYMTVHHKPSKVTYNVVRQPGPGNIHSIEWGHERGSSFMLGRSQKDSISRDARRVWDQHVSHRLPHGATLHNQPAKEKLGKIYTRSGFGDVDSDNDQFAKVGREKSPKQKARGKKSRLTPLDSKKVKRDAGWDKN